MEYVEPDFEVKQIALNMEQIKEFNPPPNPAKLTDPRAKWYITKFGQVSWELDSLPPEVLIELAEKGILEYLNITKYNKVIAREKREIKQLQEYAKTIGEENT